MSGLRLPDPMLRPIKNMRTLALASLLAGSLAACGGGDGSGGPLGDDVTTGDDTSSVDGGHTSSGKVGSIWVSRYSYTHPQTGTIDGSSVSAQFYPQQPSTWNDTADAGCYMSTYTTGPGTQFAQTSAGTVKFGTSPPTTLVPDGSGTYMAATMENPLSGNISVDVSGATVPAFTGTATIPPAAILTQPSIVAGKLTINRATDLVVKWTGGGGDVSITVGSAFSGGSTMVNCVFAASAHQGTVPANLLSQLPTGTTGSFGASIQAKTMKDAGDWTIWIGATNSVNTTDGASASATATLQ
ncbi:hypothetical protein BH11MYX2_BH11MYX2_08100 [soil metagenome]